MRLVKTLPILLSLGAALGSASAWSLPNDQQQPIRIQADDAQLDDKNGIATYTGDVIITQGSMKVTGNKVTMTRAPNGDIDVVTSVGNLAYFEQLQTQGDANPVKGYGVTIQYHAQQNRVVLIDKAKVVDFVSNNDIIGGNSGSPILDAKGAVIGAVFDGNIHSLGGNFGFDETLNRSVSVSTMAVEEALTKIYPAPRLIAELHAK